jgi:hypothetical protein
MTNTRLALQYHLLGIVTASEVDWENDNFTPPSLDTPYYKSDLMQGRGRNLSIDTMDGEGAGVYQITLSYPVKQGTVPIEDEAQAIIDHFKGETLIHNDARVRILTQPYYTELTPTNDRYIGAISVAYTTNKI